MRVIVTVVIRINVTINVKMEYSVVVQSETREIPDCPVHMWQMRLLRPRVARRPVAQREGWLEKSCKDGPPKGGLRGYVT